MKKICLGVLFLMLTISIQGFSQTADEKAATKAQKITTELGLTGEQTEKVKKIYLDEDQKTAALKSKYGNTSDKTKYHQEAKALRDQTEKSIQYILTASQKTKFESLHAHGDKEKKK